jgi:hypothetical protein
MLVFGRGAAVLESRRPWAEHAGLAVSLAGLLLLALPARRRAARTAGGAAQP